MTPDELRTAVEQTYAAEPLAEISWPDPNPDRDPAEEQYSRVSDPQRYRVVGARVEAWVQTLTDLGLATAERTEAGISLRPHAAGAQPLLLRPEDLEGVPGCVVRISAGDPPRAVGLQPDCGCDACDSGSADLLTAIDDEILAVVGGGFVYATGRGWELHTTVDGWAASGLELPDHAWTEDLLTRVRAGEEVAGAIYGAAW